MEAQDERLNKKREVVFSSLHPDPNQAGSAAEMLLQLDGVDHVDVLGPGTLEVHYQLLKICLAEIEQLLEKRGFHLDNRLVCKVKRALYYYTEETQRANLGVTKDEAHSTQKVFVNRYRNREHGCQDERPEHWRRYL